MLSPLTSQALGGAGIQLARALAPLLSASLRPSVAGATLMTTASHPAALPALEEREAPAPLTDNLPLPVSPQDSQIRQVLPPAWLITLQPVGGGCTRKVVQAVPSSWQPGR